MHIEALIKTTYERPGIPRDIDEKILLEGLQAAAAELNKLDGVVAGTASASKAAVLGANKNLDTLTLAELKVGAGAVSVVPKLEMLANVTADQDEVNLLTGAPVTSTVTVTAGAANVSEVTFQLRDTNGQALTRPDFLDIWLSDSATGEAFAAVPPDTFDVKAAAGEKWMPNSNAFLHVQTTGTGLVTVQITSAAKAAFYICAKHALWAIHMVEPIEAADYGA